MKRPTRRSRVLTWAAVVYGATVALSHLVRARGQATEPIKPGDRVSVVPAVGGGSGRAPVRIVFRQTCPESPREPPIVLIHGSPGAKEDLSGLVPTLALQRCVLVPDLPGFGRSTYDIPDYSLRAHARYLVEWLQTLGVERAHVLGFSMGGGVALELIASAPAKVASLTMLSAIGVQEFELFGNYHVNHVIHAAQLVGLWCLREGTPHMGRLDGSPFTLAYARNFYDSDQRPLRDILRHVDVPTLIVHGVMDSLVPYDAAREHHRLVPQSQLHTFDDGHFWVFHNGPEIARIVAGFLERVDSGLARTRRTADPARVMVAARPDILSRPPLRGLPLYVAGAIAVAAGFLTLTALFVFALRRRKRRRAAGTTADSEVEIP